MKTESDMTILVVDDEELLRKALGYLLRRSGFKVVTACDGREAYGEVCSRKIDLILSDVRMPGGDGIELIKNVKKRDPATPLIIFITAFADLSTEEAFNLGASAILSKPFNTEQLLERIRRALGLSTASPRVLLPNDLALHGDLPEDQFGRGGFRTYLPNETDIFVDALCSFKMTAPFSSVNFQGEGIVRWCRPDEHGGCWIGVEVSKLEEKAAEAYSKWVNGRNPIAHIPLKLAA